MPGSHSCIYIHLVFAPKSRLQLHSRENRDTLLSYISSIISNLKSHLITGYVMPDHVHLLISLHPSLSVSELAQKVKANSSHFINLQSFVPGKFAWNEGYGAFSVSQSRLLAVRKYIEDQEEHHTRYKLEAEMAEFLKAHHLIPEVKDNFWEDKER